MIHLPAAYPMHSPVLQAIHTRLLECRQNVGNHAGRPEDVATTVNILGRIYKFAMALFEYRGVSFVFPRLNVITAGYYTPVTTHQITNMGVLVVRMRMQNQIERGRFCPMSGIRGRLAVRRA